MNIGNIINTMRFSLQDTNAVKFTDYEILSALNSTLRIMNNALVKMGSSLTTKETVLFFVNSTCELPSDFICLNQVNNNEDYSYKIVGNYIYSENDHLNISYSFCFPELTLDSELPVPDWFNESIKRYSLILLTGQLNQYDANFFKLVYDDLISIVANRDIVFIDRQLPYIV